MSMANRFERRSSSRVVWLYCDANRPQGTIHAAKMIIMTRDISIMERNISSYTPSIADIESDLEGALECLRDLDRAGRLPHELRPLVYLAPPDGASVHVSLRERESGRQIRRNASRQSFAPRNSGAWIVYEVPQSGAFDDGAAAPAGAGDPLVDFLLSLDQAERDPHLHFVSLKWFRDTYLQKCGFGWARDPDLPRRLIQDTTERDLIQTSKVPNPKSPSFPVTSIHLNRAHPEVRQILGEAGVEIDFQPIDAGS